MSILTSIDARLLLPGDLFLDPLGLTAGVFVLDGISVENTYPHGGEFANEAVPTVTLTAHRHDDGETPIQRILDPGAKVKRVIPPPKITVEWNGIEWTVDIDNDNELE